MVSLPSQLYMNKHTPNLVRNLFPRTETATVTVSVAGGGFVPVVLAVRVGHHMDGPVRDSQSHQSEYEWAVLTAFEAVRRLKLSAMAFQLVKASGQQGQRREQHTEGAQDKRPHSKHADGKRE